jgi:predicted ATPase/DNA-binding CsgD family transcriptional regulator
MSQASRHDGSQSLPSMVTALVGRGREIESVSDLLRRPAVRLVTLSGPGGVGKTRLALAVAERLRAEYRDGIAFVPLQSTSHPDLLLSVIAQALAVREAGERPLFDLVADALRARELLLVLDNFEHLLAAGPRISDLLATCPDLTILVTSRAVLRLAGEHDYIVPPLSFPALNSSASRDKIEQSDAVRLFLDRAAAARSDFSVSDKSLIAVGAICAKLDGLPLAIELAAARTRVLSPATLLARLEQRLQLLSGGPRDAPSRQQTMRATIAWSHDLISEEHQRLFRCLAVFSGGASLEAVESVCSVGEETLALDGLATLVDHSLVRHREQSDGSSRFEMLETIREFGLEQLGARSEAAEARERQVKKVAGMALRAEAELYGTRQMDWFERLEGERANLRAALDWALEHDLEAALQAAAALWDFWVFRAHFSEARAWLDIALARDGNVTPTTRARALRTAASLAGWQGDYHRAGVLFQEALRIFRELDDRPNIAITLCGMCRLAVVSGDLEQADIYGSESVALLEAIGDTHWLMAAVGNLGWSALFRGDLERARPLLDEALSIARRREDVPSIVSPASGLGFLALLRRDVDTATRLFTESLQTSWQIDDPRFVTVCLNGLHWVATMEGKHRRAARLFGATEALRQAIGLHAVEDFLRPELGDDRNRLGPATFDAAVSEGRLMTLEQAVKYALTDELPAAMSVPATPGRTAGLTPRELDVLRLVAEGKTDREIGAELFISPNTVMNHVSHILAKLDVDSRTAAAAYALRHDLV